MDHGGLFGFSAWFVFKIVRDDDNGSRSVLLYRHDDIHYRLAQAYDLSGDTDRAMREIHLSLVQNPENTDALYQLFELDLRNGRNSEAEALIERRHAAMGDYPKARYVLTEAVRRSPDDAWILDVQRKVVARAHEAVR